MKKQDETACIGIK